MGDIDAVHRGDVDDLGRLLSARGVAQQRRQLLGEEEARLQVQVERLVPALLRELVETRHPTGAGVVDEDVQARLALRQRLRQATHAIERGEIRREVDAGAECRELGRGLPANVRLS